MGYGFVVSLLIIAILVAIAALVLEYFARRRSIPFNMAIEEFVADVECLQAEMKQMVKISLFPL